MSNLNAIWRKNEALSREFKPFLQEPAAEICEENYTLIKCGMHLTQNKHSTSSTYYKTGTSHLYVVILSAPSSFLENVLNFLAYYHSS